MQDQRSQRFRGLPWQVCPHSPTPLLQGVFLPRMSSTVSLWAPRVCTTSTPHTELVRTAKWVSMAPLRGIQGRAAGFHCHLAICTCWGWWHLSYMGNTSSLLYVEAKSGDKATEDWTVAIESHQNRTETEGVRCGKSLAFQLVYAKGSG